MEELQVVGRFKGESSDKPRFTKTTTVSELVEELFRALPVDKLYALFPDADGQGFSLRELGTFTIQLSPALPLNSTQPVSQNLPVVDTKVDVYQPILESFSSKVEQTYNIPESANIISDIPPTRAGGLKNLQPVKEGKSQVGVDPTPGWMNASRTNVSQDARLEAMGLQVEPSVPQVHRVMIEGQ